MHVLVIVQKEGSNIVISIKKDLHANPFLVLADKMFNKKIALI